MKNFSKLGLSTIILSMYLLHVVINHEYKVKTFNSYYSHQKLMFSVADRQQHFINTSLHKSLVVSKWSGKYINSTYGELNIDFRTGRFSRFVPGNNCFEMYSGIYVGRASINGSRIKLNYQILDKDTPEDDIYELIPVVWNDVHYLVPYSKFADFKSSIDKQESPCNYWDDCNQFWIKFDDYEKLWEVKSHYEKTPVVIEKIDLSVF